MEGGSSADVGQQPNNLDLSTSPSSTETSGPLAVHVEGNIIDEGDAHMFGQLHPLHNPVFLQYLFHRCPPSILAECRLVCKQWKELSLASWRSSFFITFTWSNGIISFNGGRPFQQFLEYVQEPNNNCNLKPFRKMKLYNWDFRPTNNCSEPLDQFWDSVGGGVTSLHLSRCEFSDVEELFGLVSKRCHHLRHLTLRDVSLTSSPSQSATEMAPNYLQTRKPKPVYGGAANLKSLEVKALTPFYSSDVLFQLLSHFWAVESFRVNKLWRGISRGYPELYENELLNILSAIKLVRKQDGCNLPLRQFQIDVPLEVSSNPATQENFALLQELKLPLQQISIALNSQLNNDHVENILQHHSETLQYIRFLGGDGLPRPCSVPITVRLLNLNLKCLTLYNVSIANMSFLRMTPNLEGLRMGGNSTKIFTNRKTNTVSDSRKIVGVAELRMLKLTSFRFGYILDATELAWLGRILPNVECLEIYLSDKLFPIVCQHWGNLKELHVLGRDLSDAGVIGGQGRVEGGQPNITSLQCLEVFWFRSRNLTDISLYYGFLRLPNLKRLWTGSRTGAEFGGKAIKCLRERNVDLRSHSQTEEGDYLEAFQQLYALE